MNEKKRKRCNQEAVGVGIQVALDVSPRAGHADAIHERRRHLEVFVVMLERAGRDPLPRRVVVVHLGAAAGWIALGCDARSRGQRKRFDPLRIGEPPLEVGADDTVVSTPQRTCR